MAVKTIAQKLEQLYKLQSIDTRLDQLRAIRGELPMEVSDLEDELIGLNTRLANFETEIETFNSQIFANREQYLLVSFIYAHPFNFWLQFILNR